MKLMLMPLMTITCFLALSHQQDPIFPPDTPFTSGLIPVSASDDLFYWLFPALTSPAPLVLWLTGGPGCASEIALFYENGPFKIRDDLTLQKNEYGWNRVANMLYVDQPVGTGFSKGKDLDRNE